MDKYNDLHQIKNKKNNNLIQTNIKNLHQIKTNANNTSTKLKLKSLVPTHQNKKLNKN